MRISMLVLILSFTGIFTLVAKSSNGQKINEVKISLDEKGKTLDVILDKLQKASSLDFVYKSELIKQVYISSFTVHKVTVEEALVRLLHPVGFDFRQIGGNIIVERTGKNSSGSMKEFKVSNDIEVSGKVTSREDGEPLPGVNILIKGSSTGTISDADGKYRIVVTEDAVLVYSFVGYQSQEEVVGGRSSINVTLIPDLSQLDEVVVTGYRVQARGTITGAIASVNQTAFQEVPVDNLSNALSGRLTGVTISQAAGTPGMQSDIRVRSIGTFNNANPLYVIDGIVRDKYSFDALTPNEVENISVLKDGASASIYGSRAANGVILVTTKRGSNQPATISYQGTFGLQTPAQAPEALNAYEQGLLINDGLAYHHYYDENFVVPETDQRLFAQDELDFYKENSWDWVEELWRDPITTQHSLNVSGGNDKVKYFISGSYLFGNAFFDNLDYRKFNLRGNIDVNVTDNLRVSLDLNTNNRITKGPNRSVNDWTMGDLYKNLVTKPNLIPPYINGQPVGNWMNWSPAAVTNREIGGYNDTEWTALNATIVLNYEVPFIDGLGLNVKYNRYQRDQFVKQFGLPYSMPVFNTYGSHNNIVGDEPVGVFNRSQAEFLSNRNDRDKSYQFNAQMNYNKLFGKHNIDALVVYEQTESTFNWFMGRRDNFLSPTIDQFVGGGRSVEEQRANGAESETARLSYVGSVNYDYDEKYLLQGSFRYDGSVIFSPENRWGFFPSGSAGWRISKEPFFNSAFVNDLMIRGSVGLVGNDNVGSFQWLQSFNIVDGAAFNEVTTGLEPGTLANRDISWEKSLSYNFGIDTRFWDNRINLKADMFFRHTYDILLPRVLSVPTTFGASLPDENYAEVDGRGIEIELGYNGMTGNGNNTINYYVRGNIGYANSEIVKVDVGENTRPYESKIGRPVGLSTSYDVNLNGTDILFGLVASDIIRTQEDLEALPEGYTIFGEAPKLGMLNYRDIRGPNSDAPDGRITNDDREFLGKNSIAPINYGLSLGASWKSFKIDILFQGMGGHKIMLDAVGRQVQARPISTAYSFWEDRWTINNPDATYPAARMYDWPTTDYPPSSWFVKNGSFLRLKNLTVSYSLPKGFLKTKNIGVFYTGTNLLMVFDHMDEWKYDPEVESIMSYPIMTTHSFGLNIAL